MPNESHDSTVQHAQPVIVVGAGPVGLAAALQLAAQGRPVTVYEGREELALSDENSYPIGVNPRGQEALRRIDPALVERLREGGEVVEGFRIYAGKRAVATLPSGTLVGTTRARLTRLLLDRAEADPSITLVTGHRLVGANLAQRTLTFQHPSGETVDVDASEARVLACDGVRSAARQAMVDQLPDFDPQIGDWGVRFRVLFSQPGATAPDLDPAWHHIFTSQGVYTATLPNQVWCVAVTAIEGDPAEDLLLSREASDAHVNALRRHLQTHAPLVPPLLTDDDYRAFFDREPFGGAVVRCPRVTVDEWLVLLGDAAHSVIPPTGEGVNSGLEDTFLLADALASGSATPFADYNAARIPDLDALGEYAWHLKDNVSSDDPARSATNVGLRILGTLGGAVGRREGQVEARLFGPDAGLTPYRDAIGPWIEFRDRWTRVLRPTVGTLARTATQRRGEGPVAASQPEAETVEPQRITVIGASSGTGALLAEQAVALGHHVTCVSRSGSAPTGATAIQGDATDPAVVRRAVEGADAVFITVGAAKGVPRQRTAITRVVVEAMEEAGVRRLVVQTSLGTGGSARQLPQPQRTIAPAILAKPLADHDAQETVVRRSGLDWTIVRPAGLTNGPTTRAWRTLRLDEEGTLGGMISRADVAAFMLHCLEDDDTLRSEIGLSGS